MRLQNFNCDTEMTTEPKPAITTLLAVKALAHHGSNPLTHMVTEKPDEN